jgi:hypothetical protein
VYRKKPQVVTTRAGEAWPSGVVRPPVRGRIGARGRCGEDELARPARPRPVYGDASRAIAEITGNTTTCDHGAGLGARQHKAGLLQRRVADAGAGRRHGRGHRKGDGQAHERR